MKRSDDKRRVTLRHARRLLKFLSRIKRSSSPFLILTHDYPDPDALASAFGLQYLAERGFGISSKIVYGGVIGRMENKEMVDILKLPVHKLKPSDFRKYQRFALMDTQPGFHNNSFPKNKRATIVIDQHPFDKKPLADLSIVDTECGATCVILAQALILRKLEIPMRVATALAYGIMSDTLNFYRVGSFHVYETYLKILPHSDMHLLARIQNPARSRKFFSTLGSSIQNAKVCKALIVSHLGFVENPDLVSQMADFFLGYKRMHWALCTGRFRGKLHVSLRIARTTTAEAGEILRDTFESRGKAGGRGNIAGGSFEVGSSASEAVWKEKETQLVQRLKQRIRLPSKSEFYFPFR